MSSINRSLSQELAQAYAITPLDGRDSTETVIVVDPSQENIASPVPNSQDSLTRSDSTQVVPEFTTTAPSTRLTLSQLYLLNGPEQIVPQGPPTESQKSK